VPDELNKSERSVRPEKASPRVSAILGLPVDDDEVVAKRPLAAAAASVLPEATLELTVIVPARNEERNLPGCLESMSSLRWTRTGSC
jgi:hypothetical protein